ncbi:MAG: hypothetical protein HQK81_09700 [Desulfovibrionaceae bacterium]|nr:hypothetical protein [Desulfovibrionaceae bacterium]MBF0514313.1 hypothetical protein [Desulfovibrionaceae bacterium]
MTMKELRDKAKPLGVKFGVGVSKTDAVRQIQIAEGFDDCFGRGLFGSCGQPDCCFRTDCEKIPG